MNTVAVIQSWKKATYRRIEARQAMPVGALDKLIAEILSEKPDQRTVLRLSTSDQDEIVIARDRRGNERIEVRPFIDGAYQLAPVPHVFVLKRGERP